MSDSEAGGGNGNAAPATKGPDAGEFQTHLAGWFQDPVGDARSFVTGLMTEKGHEEGPDEAPGEWDKLKKDHAPLKQAQENAHAAATYTLGNSMSAAEAVPEAQKLELAQAVSKFTAAQAAAKEVCDAAVQAAVNQFDTDTEGLGEDAKAAQKLMVYQTLKKSVTEAAKEHIATISTEREALAAVMATYLTESVRAQSLTAAAVLQDELDNATADSTYWTAVAALVTKC